MWKDAKYLIAFVAPLSAFLGIFLKGYWSFSGIYVGFVLIPLLELISPQSEKNFPPEEEEKRATSVFLIGCYTLMCRCFTD